LILVVIVEVLYRDVEKKDLKLLSWSQNKGVE